MFEVGWTEILVIAIVALIVFPTKDLPRLLRTVGQLVGKARRMAGDMQSQFNQALREAERQADLDDIKGDIKNANPLTDLKKTLDPVRTFSEDLKASVTSPIMPKPTEAAPVAASEAPAPVAVPETPVPVAMPAAPAEASPVAAASAKDGNTP